MENLIPTISSDAINSDLRRVTCTIIVEGGTGIIFAVAIFKNGVLESYACAKGVDKELFLKESAALVENSIPVNVI